MNEMFNAIKMDDVYESEFYMACKIDKELLNMDEYVNKDCPFCYAFKYTPGFSLKNDNEISHAIDVSYIMNNEKSRKLFNVIKSTKLGFITVELAAINLFGSHISHNYNTEGDLINRKEDQFIYHHLFGHNCSKRAMIKNGSFNNSIDLSGNRFLRNGIFIKKDEFESSLLVFNKIELLFGDVSLKVYIKTGDITAFNNMRIIPVLHIYLHFPEDPEIECNVDIDNFLSYYL